MPRSAFLVICWIAAWSPAASAAEDLGSFLDRVVTAYGGEAALTKPGVVRQTGHTVSEMRGGASGKLVRMFQSPNKLRVEISYPGEDPEVRLLDGSHGWNKGEEATAPMRGAMQLQAARLALPLVLLEKKATVMDQGASTGPDGQSLRILELPLGPHSVLFVAVDVASGRILASRGILNFGGGASMEFATRYREYRHWQGRLYAGKEEQYAMGRYTGYTVIDDMEILDSVGPGAFRP